MAMIMLNQKSEYNVKFGTNNDACVYCVAELMKAEKISEIEAVSRLRGTHVGEKIWYIGGADDLCVCREHLEKILKEMTPDCEEDE